MQPDEVLKFWFEETEPQKWFVQDDAFDATIKQRFYSTYQAARAGSLDAWASSPEGTLALVIVLDQFPRNLFRTSGDAFATDSQALDHAKNLIATDGDQQLPPQRRHFLYLSFMHSENLADQEKGVELYQNMGNADALHYMRQHHKIIERFGRFPHRNQMMDRPSTKDEEEYLERVAQHGLFSEASM
ncbi:MAG: DUF924 family protein [Alphaproteobacteria bacterium]